MQWAVLGGERWEEEEEENEKEEREERRTVEKDKPDGGRGRS